MLISSTASMAPLFASREISRGRFIEALESAMPSLRGDLETRFATVSWGAVCDALLARVPAILDFSLPEVVLGEWWKRLAASPHTSYPLPQKLDSVRTPCIEMLFDGLTFAAAAIQVRVTFATTDILCKSDSHCLHFSNGPTLVPCEGFLAILDKSTNVAHDFHAVEAEFRWPTSIPLS